MTYKTTVLALLMDRPDLHEQLRRSRRLLRTVDAMASDLRDRHLAWTQTLAERQPGSATAQVSAEAMELAIAELEFPSPTQTT